MDEYRIVSILDNNFQLKDTEDAKSWMSDVYAKPLLVYGRAIASHLSEGKPTGIDLVTSSITNIICNTNEIVQFKTKNSFYTFLKL